MVYMTTLGKTPETYASNAAIVAACWQVLRQELRTETRSGWCLRFVREVVQHAYGLSHGQFYTAYRVAVTSSAPGRTLSAEPWASDLEASMKQLGYGVSLAQRLPGDIVFNWRLAAPYGHIAILMDSNTVLELSYRHSRPRSYKIRGGIVLTPLELFAPTLLARLPNPLHSS